MAIYHLHVQMMGRSSGCSAVAAVAYRTGEKLRAMAAAAYRSGKELFDEWGAIIHDYRRKSGVVYSEIMLPEDAPSTYLDRETLWNAVEHSEKRRDAQLVREVEVALPRAFDLREQVEVLREYIQENFVSKGMIADFSIHDKGDGNPHAHIMLTTRHVSRGGFGLKNRDWEKKERLLKWRENWASVNNRMFEQKGLDIRIDHRTLEAQGIDLEPTIHMGRAATAMERRGIKTERGDINRGIKERNRDKTVEMAEQMFEARENYIEIYRKIHMQQKLEQQEYESSTKKILDLHSDIEKIERYLGTIRDLHDNVVIDLQAKRQKLRFWNIIRKIKLDRAIKEAEQEVAQARERFKHNFNFEVAQAPAEICRIREKIRVIEREQEAKTVDISALYEEQNAIKLEYQKLKLLTEIRTDGQQIIKILEEMKSKNMPKSVRDMQSRNRNNYDRDLDFVATIDFRKIVDALRPSQAQALIDRRNRAAAKNRAQVYERSR